MRILMLILFLAATPASAVVNIDWVTVGEPGNATLRQLADDSVPQVTTALMAFGAAHQGPDGPSTLYTINLNTGLAAPIGPIGFERVSGMDFHPETGKLYATAERADGSNTGVLITIDPLTGVGAEVGPFVAGGVAVGLSFRSDGTLFRYEDLPQFLERREGTLEECRVHFHVPVFVEHLGPCGTTRFFLEDILPRLDRATALEVETYSLEVLPADLRRESVADSIARELAWVQERIDEADRRT